MPLLFKKHVLLIAIICLSICASAQRLKTKQEKGYFNVTNIAEPQLMYSIDSVMLENGTARFRPGFEVSTVNGLFINNSFSIGLGIGAQFSNYKYYEKPGTEKAKTKGPEIISLPIWADFRYYPQNTINGALFIINAGYAPSIKFSNESHKQFLDGGPFVKIGAGYKFYISNLISFVPSLNFRAQRFDSHTVVGGTLGLGLMF